MKLIPNQKSEYGDFDLIPTPGFKLYHFIDFASKLLVVNESLIDTSHLPSYRGTTVSTPIVYIIDSEAQKILHFEDWCKYFNYEPIETFSEDGKLKEIWIRKHIPERGTDSYEGYLLEVETGHRIIEGASSVAFNDRERLSLIKEYYKDIERNKEYLRSLERGVYPEGKFHAYLAELTENQLVFEYNDEYNLFRLEFIDGTFNLKKGVLPKFWEKRDDLIYDSEHVFKSIQSFWNYFQANKFWYKQYQARTIENVLKKFIITAHNQILDEGEISYQEHEKLHDWMNRCYDSEIERNVYWQFCSNCRERVFYNPRYPKHACRKCVEILKDEFGIPLDYQTTHDLREAEGGLYLCFQKEGKQVRMFIENDEYWASEARFGGIVHQKKEN